MTSSPKNRLSLRIPLRVVIVVPFLILIFLATGLVGYLSYRNAQQTVRDIVNQLRSEINGRIQDHLRTFLEIPPRINQINANAIRRGWVETNDPHSLERYFREQLQVYDSVTSIYFGNEKGGLANAGREGVKGSQYVMVTDGFVKGHLHKYATDNLGNRVKLLTTIPFFDATVRPWYTRAVTTGDDAWSDIYTLVTGQDMAIAASRPVYDKQRTLLGVVSIDIFLSQLSGFLKTLDIGKTGISFIMEPSGLLIASSTDEKPLTRPSGTTSQTRLDSHKSAIPLIRHAAEAMTGRFGNYHSINKAQNFDYRIDGQLYFLRVSPFQTNNGLNWLIVTVMPESDFMAQINVNNRNTALLIGAILIVAIILCIITAQLITIPILHLNTAAQSLAKGNWDEIRTVQWLRETGDLTLSFNHMIRQLKQMMGDLTSEVEERKRTEEAYKESEFKYRMLIEHSSNVVFCVDRNGEYKFVNQGFALTFGKMPDYFLGKTFWDIYPKEHADYRQAANSRVFATGESQSLEVVVPLPDRTMYFLAKANPVKDETGKVILNLTHATDITERKLAEETLQESERRFRELAELLPETVYETDIQGILTFVNRNAFDRFGYTKEDFAGGLNALDMVTPDDRGRALENMQRIMNGETIGSNEFTMLRKDGRTFPSMIHSTAIIHDGKSVGLRGFIVDIAERKRAEEENQRLEERLQHADKMESIGTLAGGIAHDFNNLLMGIQGYASLMLLNLDASHPHYERLKRIEDQAQSGADLTRQLLGFARGGRYEVKPTDMNDIIKKTSSMFGRTKKEISIHRKYGKDLRTVEVDQGQMDQVFMNLYVNAWQAMPGGGEIYLETGNVLMDYEQAFPYAIQPGKYVKITVTDTGTGMDEKTRERIFDPFFTTKEMGRGTGLGLATVYGIIKGHKGMITVDSKPGHGTTFTIYLPATEKEVVKGKTATGAIARGTETILLVDDEKMVVEVTMELLESLGYRVYAAGSGQEAIAVYMEKRKEIALVILDMIMPGISGGETFDRLKKIDPDIRVLLSSGYSITGEAQNILNRGCDGFLQKPFHLEKLSRSVREVLDRRKRCL